MRTSEFHFWLRKPFPPSTGQIYRTNEKNCKQLQANSSKLSNKLRNNSAETKASNPLDPNEHLKIIYVDSHIITVDKPSGALSVPGPRRNPSVANLVHEYFGNDEDDVDKMIVHRLDMDTSGILVFARSSQVLKKLHDDFRNKTAIQEYGGTGVALVSKKYEALVCGHVSAPEGDIDLPLIRDRDNPPFMKVYAGDDMTLPTPPVFLTETHMDENEALRKSMRYFKMMSKSPKESLTQFQVISKEFLDGWLPVTRLELVPITGRTHQLRVHCAAIGHPIVGDGIYGFNGEGSPNGGFSDNEMESQFPHVGISHTSLQRAIMERRRNKTNGREGLEHNDTMDRKYYAGTLCLHAKQLNLLHPITFTPLIFEADTPF